MTPRFRCWHNGKWHYATLDELCQNIGMDYGVPENVLAFIEGEFKSRSTGLTDKNRAEIFEGDILDWSGIATAAVVWSDGDAEFLLDYPDGSFGGFDTRPTLNGLKSSMTQFYEVVGNIYQNPGLLPKAA